MQQIADIPNPYGKATLYSWNGKFILKLETNLLEQTYKISQTEIINSSQIIDLVSNPEFMEQVGRQFIVMDQLWKKHIDV